MPCYDSRDDSSYVRSEAMREFTHNSPVAEMLCTVLGAVNPELIQFYPENIRAWWADHQKRDALKKANEAAQ